MTDQVNDRILEMKRERDELQRKCEVLNNDILIMENKVNNMLDRDEISLMRLQYHAMMQYGRALDIRIQRSVAIDALGGVDMLINGNKKSPLENNYSEIRDIPITSTRKEIQKDVLLEDNIKFGV